MVLIQSKQAMSVLIPDHLSLVAASSIGDHSEAIQAVRNYQRRRCQMTLGPLVNVMAAEGRHPTKNRSQRMALVTGLYCRNKGHFVLRAGPTLPPERSSPKFPPSCSSSIIHLLTLNALCNCPFGRSRGASGPRPVTRQLAQAHVQRFGGIDRVDHLADLRRQLEERDDVVPVAAPQPRLIKIIKNFMLSTEKEPPGIYSLNYIQKKYC